MARRHVPGVAMNKYVATYLLPLWEKVPERSEGG